MAASDNANSRQVGGRHYDAVYQHWDLVERIGMGYLEGCATKYIFRWRKKGGTEDLRKAAHYIDKLVELHEKGGRVNRVAAHVKNHNQQFLMDMLHPQVEVGRFLDENRVPAMEGMGIWHLAHWSEVWHLTTARWVVTELIREEENGT